MAKYRILSLDGGGIRGLIPAIVMQRLEQQVPGWLEKVDMFAGTSTGGIMALALAKGLKPEEIRNLYYNRGPYIFYEPFWNKLTSLFNLLGAKHPNDHLREEITKVLRDTQLKDLEKKVLISTFNLNDKKRRTWKAKFFHNFERVNPENNQLYDPDGYFRAADVAMYTSAAPTFLPGVDTFVDGGVAANNPSMAALAQTQDTRYIIDGRFGEKARPQLGEVVMLSLGTGDLPTRVQGKNHNWGVIPWTYKIRLLNIMFEGVVGVADYQSRQILGDDRYMRLNPNFTDAQNFALDDVKRLNEMVTFASTIPLDNLVEWLNRSWLKD